MKKAGIGIAIAAAVAGLLYWVTLAHAGMECEVCIQYRGRQQCATAAAADEHAATQAATMTACGVLAGGVTDGIACETTEPISRRCTAP
jgi:hypothetical protein